MYKIQAESTFKGRVVVQGWGQVPGNDSGSTFAPVRLIQGIRMVLAAAAELTRNIYQIDVRTTFLNAPVQEEVHVKMAPVYEEKDTATGVPLVMELKRSPYLWFSSQSPLN